MSGRLARDWRLIAAGLIAAAILLSNAEPAGAAPLNSGGPSCTAT